VKDLSESLEIIEVGATALCRRDVTVLMSEKIFNMFSRSWQKKQELSRRNC